MLGNTQITISGRCRSGTWRKQRARWDNRLVVLDGGTDEKIEAAFAALAPQHVSALLVGSDPFFDTRRETGCIGTTASSACDLSVCANMQWPAGLMSYGTSITDMYRLAGLYVGRILKGEKPADLPVMQVDQVRARDQPHDCESARRQNFR